MIDVYKRQIITLIVVLSVLSSSLLGQVDDQLQNITEEYLSLIHILWTIIESGNQRPGEQVQVPH